MADVAEKTPSEDIQTVDVDKLGRQRPEIFSSTWMEVAFVSSVIFSLAMADFIISGFQVVLPVLIKPLHIPPEAQTWPSNVLTLVAGAFLFPLGRVADMYGGYLVFHAGLIWFILFTVLAGFSQTFTMLIACRALQGLGAAAFMPAGISLLGKTYRPGPRKNLVFSIYGAMAPLGFFVGIIVAGAAEDLLSWRWYFFFGGILAAISCVGSLLTSPRDYAEARKLDIKMDWWGVFTTVPGLMLFVYAITDSVNAPGGWLSPRILVTLILGLGFLGAAVYVEGWVAENPLIPADIFHVPYIKRMLVCLFFTWGCFSIYLYYSNFYIELILGKSPLLTSVYFAPWAAGGVVLALSSGVILHLLPSRLLLILCGATQVLAMLMFALMPNRPNYWAWIFVAMLAEAMCNDILWTMSNVFLTTSLPKRRQGLAGAVISVTLFLGGAFFLAIIDVAKAQFVVAGVSLKMQYKYIFWIGVGIAGVALAVCFFINIDKAAGALTADEREAREAEERKDSVASGRSSGSVEKEVQASETLSQAQAQAQAAASVLAEHQAAVQDVRDRDEKKEDAVVKTTELGV